MLASRAALREGARAAASARVAVLPSAVRHCLRGGWPLTAGAAAPAATACGAVYSTLSAPTGCSSLLKVAHAPRRAAPAPTRDGTRSPCRRRTTTTTTTAAAAASPASAAYPHLERGHELVLDFATLADQHQYLAAGEKAAAAVRVAGRITAKRQMGTKLAFYDVQSAGKVLQLLSRNTTFRRGDIIEASGVPGRTKTGEFSVFALGDADQCKLLASCLSNIPEALTDPELRHRLRHLELLVNPDLHRALRTRAKAISFLRGFLDARGFLEVETPVLCSQAGGAAAEPFATHSRALDADLVLRIAPELRLKELVIGGIDRVYEIGKQFRNEGVDTTHNPEFTTCEFYQAYADFEQLVATTEELVSGMVEACVGGHELGSPHGHTLNFTPPFRRISIADELRKALGRDLPLADDEQESVRLLLEALEERRLDTGGPHTLTVLLDRLISAIVEPRCTQPTFLLDHPLAMSPLAKQHKTMPDLASRFELFVDGREICNAYVELNDPAEQRRRFHQQLQDRAAGDKEAALPDEAFCSALEFGLPPTVGWGMGIDRMVMLLSGATSIRDVIAFPMLRPKSGDRSSRGLADLD